MTRPIFFDTDCLSAFLWVNKQEILVRLYPGMLKIPEQVYAELSSPTVPHLKRRIDILLNGKKFEKVPIQDGSAASDLYVQMSLFPSHYKLIGSGEAACIALAQTTNGVVASNNLNDVVHYITKYHLQHLTTGDIMVRALDNRLITNNEADEIWEKMLYNGCKIGANTFSDFLRTAKP